MTEKLVKEPIYQQLNKLLRDSIQKGEFLLGSKFLTERSICTRFGVSRATANKALSSLVSEGLLEFKKGVGTFVRFQTLNYDLHTHRSFTSKAIASGKTPRTEVIDFQYKKTSEVDMISFDKMQVLPTDDIYCIERLRFVDEIPVILEKRCIVAKFCPELQKEDLSGSLYALWDEKYNLQIIGCDEIIRAITISGNEAKLLKMRSGEAGFLMLALGYLQENQTLWWEKTLYRGDAYEFHNHLGPVQSLASSFSAFIEKPRS